MDETILHPLKLLNGVKLQQNFKYIRTNNAPVSVEQIPYPKLLVDPSDKVFSRVQHSCWEKQVRNKEWFSCNNIQLNRM